MTTQDNDNAHNSKRYNVHMTNDSNCDRDKGQIIRAVAMIMVNIS